jgi:hypothetical protein
VFDTGQGQGDRRKATVDDQHQPPSRQPAAHLLHNLPHPLHMGLVPSPAAWLSRPAPRRQEGQRPHPLRPRHRDQQPHRHPLQAEAVHDVGLARPYRIAIAPFGGHLPSMAAFHGVSSPEDNRRPRGYKARDEQPKQNPTGLAGGPRGPVQDAMVIGAVAFRGEPHHPQGRGHRAGSGRHNRPQESYRGMAPNPLRKAWRERGEDQDDRFGQGWRHGLASVESMTFERAHLSYGTSRFPAYAKWPKPRLKELFKKTHEVFSGEYGG